MGKFNNNKNVKKENNFRGNQQQKKFQKPSYVKKQIKIAYSDFYADMIDSLYNLLSEITWNKISIPVKMSKSEFFNDDTAKGTIVLGNVVKFNNDNTFTISVSEDNAKAITDNSVMSVKCYKDKTTNEINYVAELTVTNKATSIDEHYKDIEQAFTDSNESEK